MLSIWTSQKFCCFGKELNHIEQCILTKMAASNAKKGKNAGKQHFLMFISHLSWRDIVLALSDGSSV